jgi:hypothetical protein
MIHHINHPAAIAAQTWSTTMSNAALTALSMTQLVELHNKIPGVKPATGKTFSTRQKAVDRIEKLAQEQKLNLAKLQSGGIDAAAAKSATEKKAKATGEKPARKAKKDVDPVKSAKAKGIGIGEAVKKYLADASLSYEQIAAKVNAEIEGASTSAKSVAWYACQLRKTDSKAVPHRPRATVAKPEGEEKPKRAKKAKAEGEEKPAKKAKAAPAPTLSAAASTVEGAAAPV